MKYILLVCLVIAALTPVHSTINLTNSTVWSVGGTPQETNSQAGVTNFSVDYTSQSMTVIFKHGTAAGQILMPGPHGETVTVVVNLVTGFWNSTAQPSGVTNSGTMTGAQLTSLNTTLRTVRNTFETFAVNNAVNTQLAGSQVAW